MNPERIAIRPNQIFDPDDDGIPIEPAIRFFRRRRRPILGAALLGTTLAVLYAVLAPAKFTATAAFTPQAPAAPQSSIAGLASQFGLSLPTGDVSRSPAFYADLLLTREILGSVADSTYSYADGRDTLRGTYTSLAKIRGPSAIVRHDRAVIDLRRQVAVGVVQRTGVVGVAVSTRAPELSYQLLQQLLKQVDQFNRSTRQSQAAAERRFTEQRLEQVGAELRAAENSLQEFLQENRGDFSRSPQLAFREQRLQRDLGLRQAVFTTLSQAFEQAKIEAVRDTPLITVIDPPQIPSQSDPRGILRKVVVGVVAGLGLGVLVGLLLDLRERRRTTAF